MLRSFLLITLRILWRNKVTSFVNIFSLSVGITSFIFIMLYVYRETSYDKFNSNYDRIYRLEADDYGRLPPMLGMHLKEKLPEVENVTFLSIESKSALTYSPKYDPEHPKQIEAISVMADSTTFKIFTFPLIKGDPHTALAQPMTIVLNESTASKLFGDVNPMGKTVKLDRDDFTVTGIMRDVKMSHIPIDILISHSSWPKIFPDRNINDTGHNSWAWSGTYLLIMPGSDKTTVEKKINSSLAEINDGSIIDTEFRHFRLRPMSDLYFNGAVQKLSYGLQGNLKGILVLVASGIFILVLGVINYVNLTTARSSIRSKELAVKRVTGSSVNLLRAQLIGESVIISLVSLTAALTMVQISLPKFNQLTSIDLQMEQLKDPLIWAGIFGGGVIIGILAGLYPAFYLTAIQPAKLIKGATTRSSDGSLFRSTLMTFQFSLSIIMIIAIIVNFRQLKYLRSADLGFNKGQIIIINTPGNMPNEFELRKTFKARLLQHPRIENVAFSWGYPGVELSNSPTIEVNGVRSAPKMLLADAEYLKVMGISIVQGRELSVNEDPGGRNISVMLNEAAVREYGLEDPLGNVLHTIDSNGYHLEIIGIVSDFHFRSFHDKIEPLLFAAFAIPGVDASVRIAPSNIPETLKIIETEFKNIWGQTPFNYTFLDDAFNSQYQRDEQLAKVIRYFTVSAVIIACLGLFALSSFIVSRRTKEIGIRKTMGASIGIIYLMLSWDFLKWILVAIALGCPVAWYLMNLWLQTFAYHITISADIFVIASLLAIAIALLTVTVQSLKVAKANPVNSLRYE